MDAIAEASGVSKATIYKHWSDKDALCVDAMARAHGLDGPHPVYESEDVRSDIVALLSYRPPENFPNVQSRLMPHLMAYAARHPTFGHAWRSRVMQPPRTELTRLLKRAVDSGQLPSDLDLDLSVALLLGPMVYRYFLMLMKHKTPADLPERVVDAFWRAHAIKTKRGHR
jgi:AcrR family transcriptional regulator